MSRRELALCGLLVVVLVVTGLPIAGESEGGSAPSLIFYGGALVPMTEESAFTLSDMSASVSRRTK